MKQQIMVAPSKIGASFSGQENNNRINPGKRIEAILSRVSSANNKHFERLFNRHSNARSSGEITGRAFDAAGSHWTPQLSSARASNNDLGVEMAKVFNVKQGFYSDVYDEMDFPNATTRPPADRIEDAMRISVLQLFDEQQQRGSPSAGSKSRELDVVS